MFLICCWNINLWYFMEGIQNRFFLMNVVVTISFPIVFNTYFFTLHPQTLGFSFPGEFLLLKCSTVFGFFLFFFFLSALFMFFHIKQIISNICTVTGMINPCIFTVNRFLRWYTCIAILVRGYNQGQKHALHIFLHSYRPNHCPTQPTHNCFCG